MTHLRKMMLEELQRRNYSEHHNAQLPAVREQFAEHFGKSPDQARARTNFEPIKPICCTSAS